ncbi:MAG: GDSL-type esterase/lipase family protein [Muribaculaceae bacterium]
MKHISIMAAALLAAAFTQGCAAQAPNDGKVNEKPKYNELYYQRASLFDALGVDSTDIVFLGNSLTHGCEWHELFDMPNIKNRGINGDIVEGIQERLASVTAGKPRKIFLLCGVNDVSHNLTADSIVTSLSDLIGRIRRETPGTQLYVESLLPINNSFGRYKAIAGKEEVIREINAKLEPVVKAQGATWINVYPAFADSEGNLRRELTNDGLHLLAPGYIIWRGLLEPYVKE